MLNQDRARSEDERAREREETTRQGKASPEREQGGRPGGRLH